MTAEQENFHHDSPKPFFPVWARIVLYIIACFLTTGILGGGASFIISPVSPEIDPLSIKMFRDILFSSLSLVAVTLCAWLFLKYLDREPFSTLGLSIKGRGPDCIAGILFAVALYAVGFGVILATGAVSIESVNIDIPVLAGTFFFFLVAAAMEEVMIRGYILNRLMTKMNKFRALIISSVIFSAMHMGNPNIGVLPLVNLFLAGLLLGTAYLYTKNLCFPIMLHVSWNWIQGSILGFEVSGADLYPPMLTLDLPENNIINGGNFGFEGSIICTILCIAGTLAIAGWYETSMNIDVQNR